MKLARRRALAALVACAVVALVAAAADGPWVRGSTGTDTPTSHAQDTSLPGTAPLPEARCPGPGAPPVDRAPVGPTVSARQLVLTTADGVNLAAVQVGGGSRGVVLVHDDGGDLCTWWSFARRLATNGFHVLVFDLRCYGYSECGRRRDYVADASAAVAALRHAGADRIVLVGTALGANVALVAAAQPDAASSGVVALSPRALDAVVTGDPGQPVGSGPRSVAEAAPRLGVPLLVCLGAADGAAAPAADLASLVAGAANRELVTVPGDRHGVDLLAGEPAAGVTAFLAARA